MIVNEGPQNLEQPKELGKKSPSTAEKPVQKVDSQPARPPAKTVGFQKIEWHEVTPTQGMQGNEQSPTAKKGELVLDQENTLHLIAPIGDPTNFSPDDWTTWIKQIFAQEQLSKYHHLMEVGLGLKDISPEEGLKHMGILLESFTRGVANTFDDLRKKNPNLAFPQIAFIGLGDLQASFSVGSVGAEPKSGTILLNPLFFLSNSLQDPDQLHVFEHQSIVGGELKQQITDVSSRKMLAYLFGLEEMNHLDFFTRYGFAPDGAQHSARATGEQYDAQAHELHALFYKWRYVKKHPEEFPPTEDGQTEEAILYARMQAARAERRRQKSANPPS